MIACYKNKGVFKKFIMFILIWFIVCIIFAFVQFILGNSGHALEVFAVLTGIALFAINKFKNKIRFTK